MRLIMMGALASVVLAACSASTPKPETTQSAAEPATPATDTPMMQQPSALQSALTLSRHYWLLEQAHDASGTRIDALFARAELPLRVDFNASMLSIGNACNLLSAHHSITGHTLTVEPMVSTQMACAEPGLMALDQAISQRLQGMLQMQFSGDAEQPVLQLTNPAGDVLQFLGKPTAETRYGGEAERIFLEVAAETKPCSHPLIPKMMCLQVREIHYDAQGLKTGDAGEFGHFYDAIEGYTHAPGVRNVLRVKRYSLANPPMDASRYVYVLDMVVESEITQK
jgi:heat shock protein HslJ